MANPINLSIGQPDFDVPPGAREAASVAIQAKKNAYTLTQGIAPLREALQKQVDADWQHPDRQLFLTSGTSGALVIAMGTSLPNGRELDDTALTRASRVLVEWRPQSLVEAGEVVLGMAAGALEVQRIADLSDLYAGRAPWRANDDEIVVFKSVGIGLADVACAWLAWQRSGRVVVDSAALFNA